MVSSAASRFADEGVVVVLAAGAAGSWFQLRSALPLPERQHDSCPSLRVARRLRAAVLLHTWLALMRLVFPAHGRARCAARWATCWTRLDMPFSVRRRTHFWGWKAIFDICVFWHGMSSTQCSSYGKNIFRSHLFGLILSSIAKMHFHIQQCIFAKRKLKDHLKAKTWI